MVFPEIFGLFDVLFFLFLVLLFFWVLSRSGYRGIERRFLLRAFALKAFATPLYLLYHKYVQKTGDIFQYHKDASFLSDIFYVSPLKFFSMIFSEINESSFPEIDSMTHFFLFEKDEAFVTKIGGVIGIFMNGSLLNVSFVFSLIALAGCWKIFLVYKRLYPELVKPLGWAILFIPSVVFWGTSITKDSICLGGLGFLVYSLFQTFVFRRKIVFNIGIMFLCFMLFLNVKIYILMAVLPALLLSFLFKLIGAMRNKFLKFFQI
jgi:hypothetical protein